MIDIQSLTRLNFVDGLQPSPANRKALFTQARMDTEDNDYKSTLWFLEDGKVRQLTAPGDVGGAIWQGEDQILFAAKRSEKEKKQAESGLGDTHYYRLDLGGGEALPAFTLPFPVSQIEWLGGHRWLVVGQSNLNNPEIYTKTQEEREAFAKEVKENADYVVVEEIPFRLNGQGVINRKRGRLFIFDDESGDLTPITGGNCDINGFYVHEDKTRALVWANVRGSRMDLFDHFAELDVAEEKMRPLHGEQEMSFAAGFYWDGEIMAVASDMKILGINQNYRLYQYNRDAGRFEVWIEDEFLIGNSVGSDARYGGGNFVQVVDKDLWYVSTRWGEAPLVRLGRDKEETIVVAKGACDSFAVLDGQVYVTGLYKMRPTELYRLEGSELEAVTSVNQAFVEEHYIAQPQRLTFESNGDEIEGWVLLPEDYKADDVKAWPAILDIHGGPKTVYGEVFYHEMQVWANQGYVVLFCNPHGSDGRGDAFSDIRGKYGTIDYEDIMAFTDEVLRRYPAVDPDRLGVTGGSYGGFMTNWIIGHTDRFKAAATQRSITNWTSFYGTSDIGYYFATDQNGTDTKEEGGFEKLWEHSPLKYINNAVTPTLIIHSTDDFRCPLEQGEQLLNALLDRGVESRMVVFKDENHELSRSGRPKGRIRRLTEICRWMDQYLKPARPVEQTDKEEASAKESAKA